MPSPSTTMDDETPTIGRSQFLPTVEEVISHPLVKKPHGKIFLLKGREEEGWMEDLLKHVAVKKCPKNREDAERQGMISTTFAAYVLLKPNRIRYREC